MELKRHVYQRSFLTRRGCYDIDNPDRLDIMGRVVPLRVDIKKAFPGRKFSVTCNGEDCVILFEQELSMEDIVVLNSVVYDHKLNS